MKAYGEFCVAAVLLIGGGMALLAALGVFSGAVPHDVMALSARGMHLFVVLALFILAGGLVAWLPIRYVLRTHGASERVSATLATFPSLLVGMIGSTFVWRVGEHSIWSGQNQFYNAFIVLALIVGPPIAWFRFSNE